MCQIEKDVKYMRNHLKSQEFQNLWKYFVDEQRVTYS